MLLEKRRFYLCIYTPSEYTCCDFSISSKYFVTRRRVSLYSCLWGFVVSECSVTQQEIPRKLLLKPLLVQIQFDIKMLHLLSRSFFMRG